MGLGRDDKMPEGIDLLPAYTAIRTWYKNNTIVIADREGEYFRASNSLINALPEPNNINEVEIIAIFSEVITGRLEWAYHHSDGKFKMAAYAHAALKTINRDYSLSENEKHILSESRIWPYLTISGYTVR
ncbi:MAG: hypothetical protein ACOYT8_00860 [Candidatus Dependentiae bacterium]